MLTELLQVLAVAMVAALVGLRFTTKRRDRRASQAGDPREDESEDRRAADPGDRRGAQRGEGSQKRRRGGG